MTFTLLREMLLATDLHNYLPIKYHIVGYERKDILMALAKRTEEILQEYNIRHFFTIKVKGGRIYVQYILNSGEYDNCFLIRIKCKRLVTYTEYVSNKEYVLEDIMVDSSDIDNIDDFIKVCEQCYFNNGDMENNIANDFLDELEKHNLKLQKFLKLKRQYENFNKRIKGLINKNNKGRRLNNRD